MTGFKKHFYRFVVTAVSVVVASVPLILANDSVRHYIDTHPAVAVYLPIAAAILRTLYKAWTESSVPSPPNP